jgi:hypothetical protein
VRQHHLFPHLDAALRQQIIDFQLDDWLDTVTLEALLTQARQQFLTWQPSSGHRRSQRSRRARQRHRRQHGDHYEAGGSQNTTRWTSFERSSHTSPHRGGYYSY